MGRRRRQQNPNGQFLCPKCQTWKYREEFYSNERTLDRISAHCKECMRAYARQNSQSERIKRHEERERIAQLELQVQLLQLQHQPPLGPPHPDLDEDGWPVGLDALVRPHEEA